MRRRTFTFLACSSPLAGWSQPAEAPIPFADAHVHLNDLAMQLALMDRFGVTHAVVFWGGRSTNDSVLEAARRHPGRLIPFASISPERTAYRPLWEAASAGAGGPASTGSARTEGAGLPRTEAGTGDHPLLRQLDAMLATGAFKGIGEISAVHFPSAGFGETDFDPLGTMVTGILELARKHRVPVMLHVEITRIEAFGGLLERFRDVPVVWAHGGYTPLFLARRMLQAHPNLVYELSARTWPRHPRSPEYTLLQDGRSVWPQWLELVEQMPDRFLVGTDASHRSLASEEMKHRSVQDFLRQLSPGARELVGRRNLLRLVGL